MIETSIYTILTGAISATVPLASMKISAVDGAAFIDCGSLGALVFARPGELLTVTDSAGKTITGYIKAAGTGETYGSELVSSWTNSATDPYDTFTPGTGPDMAAVVNAVNNGLAYSPVVSISKGLYLFSVAVTLASGNNPRFQFGQTSGLAGANWLLLGAGTISNLYRVAEAAYTFFGFYNTLVNGRATNFSTSGFSLKQVLTPAATGVTIVSTLGGSTFNWASKDAAFNYADPAGYTISRPLSSRVYPVIMSQDVVLPAISYQRISADPANTLSGASGLVNAHIVINSWARTYDEAKALALEVRTAMNAATAFKSLLVNELDGYDPDVMLFVVSQDFSVWGSE